MTDNSANRNGYFRAMLGHSLDSDELKLVAWLMIDNTTNYHQVFSFCFRMLRRTESTCAVIGLVFFFIICKDRLKRYVRTNYSITHGTVSLNIRILPQIL